MRPIGQALEKEQPVIRSTWKVAIHQDKDCEVRASEWTKGKTQMEGNNALSLRRMKPVQIQILPPSDFNGVSSAKN
ncbi:hypothetical protein FKM82_015313 [Ascaphus truei]